MRVHLPLGDVCGPSWTDMHWDPSVSPVGSAIPQVEAPSDYCSSSLHSFVHVGHKFFLICWLCSYPTGT